MARGLIRGLLVAAICVPQLALADPSPDEGLALKLSLDRHDFLPGEPLLVSFSVENHGTTTFEDLAPLHPRQGSVGLRLRRDGLDVPWMGRLETWAFTEEGPRLEAGAAVCDVFDILEYYGSPSEIVAGGKRFDLGLVLPAGKYTLSAGFQARLGVRRDLGPVSLESNEVSFVISTPAEIPESEVAAIDLLQPGAVKRFARSTTDRWGEVLKRGLYRSRYLPSLARIYLPKMDEADWVTTAAKYGASRSGRLGSAHMLRTGWASFGNRLKARGAWLNEAAKSDLGSAYGCYFRMWEKIQEQGRKYGRSED